MSSKSKWWILLSGASLAAMGAVAPAGAQEVSDEIVVTATGRTAAIQDVPLAVTALTGEAIENAGMNDIRDLQQMAPSYRFFTGQSNTSGTNAIIRGIGTGGDNPGFEAAVGVFIDGVFRSRAGVALADLPEVERVEVLRGPQGTLFGRNTSAGALSIITQGPDFEPSVWLEGTAGDFGLLGTRFGANIPAGDTLALRVDGSLRTRDGYIDDVRSNRDLNTVDRWSLRGQALLDISDNASLRVIVDSAGTDEQCCYAVTFQQGDSAAAINGYQALFTGGTGIGVLAPDVEARRATLSPARSLAESVDEIGMSAQLDWDTSMGEFTSITAYRNWDSSRSQDIDFNDMDRAYRDGLTIGFETLTQEFRLRGEAGRLDWLVGAFFGREQLNQVDTIRVGADAAHYVDALSYFADLSALGAPDANGPIPGSGYEIYRSINPAAPLFLQVALGTLAATQDPLAPGGAIIAGNLLAGALPGGLADDLALADPSDGDGQQADAWQTDTDTIALFTHNEISLSDNLILTVGARYNHEEKTYEANLNSVFPGCGALQSNPATGAGVLQYTPNPLLPAANQAALADLQGNVVTFMALACNPAINTAANGAHNGAIEEDEVTGTANLAFHLSPDTMIYGGYSRGYKSGGFNIDRSAYSSLIPFSPAPPSDDEIAFDPEFVDAYEFGLKTTLFGNTNFNVAAFYESITDFQVNAFSGFNFITFNAPELISKGVELDFLSNISDQLTFQGGVTWNDAYYNTDVVVASLVAADTIPEGTRLAYAAEWVGTAAVTYTQPITANLSALFYLDARYNSEYPVQTLNRNPATDNEAYTILNGRIGIGDNDQRWSLEAFVRNITDETYNIGAFTVPEQDNVAAYPNEPRTFGVTLKARY